MVAKMRARTPLLGPWSNGAVLNSTEYESGEYERGWRYELRNGMLLVTDELSAGEKAACELIGYLVWKHCDPESSRESVVTLPGSIIRVGSERFIPDRVIWLVAGRRPRRFEPPLIAIEFDSLRRRLGDSDRTLRRNAYFSVGVREYWIVDRFAEAVVVCSNSDKRSRTRRLNRRAVVRTRLLPGFKMHVGELIADIEGLVDFESGEDERDWMTSSRW